MATKGGGQLFLNEKCANDNDGLFTNLNLNQNYKCHDLIPVQSYSKSNFNNKFVSPLKDKTNFIEKNPELRNEESKNGGSYLKPWKNRNLFGEKKQNIIKKPWKNEISSNFTNNNSSTLSLHITAYENLIESSNQKNDSSKKLKETKTLLLSPKLKDPFEYPRQMDDHNGAGSKGTPEVMQFKASQKLLALNQKDELSDVKTDATQEIEPYELPIVAGEKVLYEAQKMIGKGGYGKVYEATTKTQNKLFALKVGDLENEIRILKKLIISPSKHLTPLIEYGSYDEESFMVMELLGDNLDVFIRDNKPSPRLLLVLAGQCLQALEALHKLEILHKDIKANNFVLGPKHSSSEYVVRIIDFGMSAEDGERNNVGYTVDIYKSIKEHLGYYVSRKTELESFFYMVCKWVRVGGLPWCKKGEKEMMEYKLQIFGDKFNDFFGSFDPRKHDINALYALASLLEHINSLSDDVDPNYDYLHYFLNLAYQRAEKAEMQKLQCKKGKALTQSSEYDNDNLMIQKFKKFEIGQNIFNEEAKFAYIANISRTQQHDTWVTEIKHVENIGIVLKAYKNTRTRLSFRCKCGFEIHIDKIDDERIWKKLKIAKQNRPHSNCEKLLPPYDIPDLKEDDDSYKMLGRSDVSKCPKINIDDYIQNLMTCVDKNGHVKDYLTDVNVIEQICVLAIENLSKMPSLLDLDPGINIVGDIHGQYTDLLRIFELCGPPDRTRYLFLGDYVDKGPQSLEVICLLLLLRVRYPNNIFLIRGNHECLNINRVYGFLHECKDRFQKIPVDATILGVQEIDLKGTQVWYHLNDVFNWLPMNALIGNKILCMHGGLSPQLESLDQLRQLVRPIDPETVGIHIDLLWSDPDPCLPNGLDDPDWGASARGISSHFNVKAVNNACNKLGLDMIVRGHQVVQDGYEFFANRKLVTIFSAPNYCGEYNNNGAIMTIDYNLQTTFHIIKPLAGAKTRNPKQQK